MVMEWDDCQKSALKMGCLVYAMDQGQYIPEHDIGPWGSARNGFCTAITARWISKHYAATELPFDPRTQELPFDFEWTRDHNIYRDDPSRFPKDYDNALKRFGLRINKGTLQSKKPIDLETIFDSVFREDCCHMILLNGKKSAHTVALSVKKGEPKARWYYFDSNEGSFQFDGRPEAIGFLRGLFTFARYRLSYQEMYLVGVRRI